MTLTREQVMDRKAVFEEAERLTLERMARRYADLQMPDDIRARARVWGLEAFCEVLWSNAFQTGYRAAVEEFSPEKPE